jgi:hypothetical protein
MRVVDVARWSSRAGISEWDRKPESSSYQHFFGWR